MQRESLDELQLHTGPEMFIAQKVSNDLGSNDLESLAQLDEAGDIYSEETDNGLLELKELNFPSSRGNC